MAMGREGLKRVRIFSLFFLKLELYSFQKVKQMPLTLLYI